MAAWQIAKRQGVVNPENTFASVKRFIGQENERGEGGVEAGSVQGAQRLQPTRSCHMQTGALEAETQLKFLQCLVCRSSVSGCKLSCMPLHDLLVTAVVVCYAPEAVRQCAQSRVDQAGCWMHSLAKAWCALLQMP